MKRLVLCCDGTWNRPDQESDRGEPCPTNVIKLAYRVAKRDGGTLQLLFYDQGVGTGNVLDRYVGGALGKGLDDNIFDAYRFLIANYEPGDHVFLFGFSRGAFTARSVAGMIRKCGIIDRKHIRQYKEALALYRNHAAEVDGPVATGFRQKFALEVLTPVQCIGVFDTVGALGVPIGGRSQERYSFHDTELSGSVKFAFHALAIDERRGAFEPTLWSYRPKDGQTVRQTWFAGVHSDAGGGYGEHDLSDITLQWMIEQAAAAGLAFDEQAMAANKIEPKPLGMLHNSMSVKYKLMSKLDRPIGLAKHRDQEEAKDTGVTATDDATQSVHPSALQRWDGDSSYRPPQLREYFRRRKDPRAAG